MKMADVVLLMLSGGLFMLNSVLLFYLNKDEEFIPLPLSIPLLFCLQSLMVFTLVNSGVVIGKMMAG